MLFLLILYYLMQDIFQNHQRNKKAKKIDEDLDGFLILISYVLLLNVR